MAAATSPPRAPSRGSQSAFEPPASCAVTCSRSFVPRCTPVPLRPGTSCTASAPPLHRLCTASALPQAEALLPEDAHERSRGRLSVLATDCKGAPPFLRPALLESFDSRASLIDALLVRPSAEKHLDSTTSSAWPDSIAPPASAKAAAPAAAQAQDRTHPASHSLTQPPHSAPCTVHHAPCTMHHAHAPRR